MSRKTVPTLPETAPPEPSTDRGPEQIAPPADHYPGGTTPEGLPGGNLEEPPKGGQGTPEGEPEGKKPTPHVKTGRPRGRPRIAIDLELATQLGKIFCSLAECAAVMGLKKSTLSRRRDFMDAWEKGKENGKATLRRAQFQAATRGNPTMLIWMGKQFLGQKDKTEIATETETPEKVLAEIQKRGKTSGEGEPWESRMSSEE